MRIRFALLVVLFSFGVGAIRVLGGAASRPALAAAPAKAARTALTGCEFPTTASLTPAELAWRLFVAANCSKGTQLVWEGWTEQQTLYPASGKAAARGGTRRFHASPLARALMKKKNPTGELSPSTECGSMQAPPSNVTKTTICEEVHLNVPAEKFIAGNRYQIRPGQTSAAKAGTTITFPTPAIEVKVDWIPGTDFTPPFTCAKPPKGVHVETIAGTCYAMAGFHITSKLMPNWIWATFEPQNLQTNPNRCITFGPCNDPWGSVPPTSSGGASGFTAQSPDLKALMQSAHLAPELFNYRLVGVQIDFGTVATPILLGNSVIEGENVGMTTGTASCITCHSVSSIQNTGSDGINSLVAMPTPPVGPEYVPPAGWIARDFVWSLGLACPDGPGAIGSLQTCTKFAAAGGAKPKPKPKSPGN